MSNINPLNITREIKMADIEQAHLADIENYYQFLCGKTPVTIRFNPDGKSLSESLINYFSSLKSGI